jgi:prepilin-type N-terminal cleavage/methylation domain-containing protein
MKQMKQKEENFPGGGFTLLEILLVIALIAILAVIVIFAINPGRQLAQARNAQRKVDVNTILNAVYQYALDNAGILPDNISTVDDPGTCLTSTNTEICITGASDNCTADLSSLTNIAKYLVAIPVDPQGSYEGSNGSGYLITQDSNNRVTVCAPKAELDETISITR